MVNKYVAEQFFSYLGLVFWSFQLAPQAYKTWKRKTSTGVSVWTMFIWCFGGILMGLYNIGINVAIPLWIQPQIFTFLALVCLTQEFYYQHKWSKLRSSLFFAGVCIFFGALQYALYYAFLVSQQKDNEPAQTFFGVIPVVVIAVGFLPQYYEIFRDKRVYGISHVFLAMDAFGSLFSIISLAFKEGAIEALALADYTMIACFDVCIIILYYIFEWYHARSEQNTMVVKDEEKDIEVNIVEEQPKV
ncbi:hypothetical protein K501DRAFT_205515 [Backusella circina FSU 941]|nr:hypothetical protein K501DRAFT_205515 [Backusella circina FSU 941]